MQYCTLGRLSHEVGWKYQDIVATLEAKRKVKGEAFHKKSVAVNKLRDQVKADPKVVKRIAPYQKIIESYGHNWIWWMAFCCNVLKLKHDINILP